MADSDNEFLFKSEIAWTSSGKEDVLGEADAIETRINELSSTIDIGISVESTDLDSLLDAPPEVNITATLDDDSVTTELDTLETTVISPNVDPILTDSDDTIGALEGLSDQQLTPDIDPSLTDSDGTVEAIEGLDGAQVKPQVDPKETEKGKAVLDRLDQIRNLQVISLVMNVTGTILEVLDKIQNFTINPFLDAEDAAAQFNAQTGQAIDNAEQLISGIKYDDLGDSYATIAELATEAYQQGQRTPEAIDEAARAVLTFTKAFPQESDMGVFRALNTLVEQGLVPNFEAGSDLLTTFFQQGGNRSGDALQAITSFAVGLKDAGLNGAEALSGIVSLLDAGVVSASDAARTITDVDNALLTAANNANSPQAEALATLGLDNPKAKGEAAGADYIAGIVSSIATSTDQETVTTALFGKGGKKFTSAIAGLSFDLFSTDSVQGAAQTAADVADSTLRGTVEDVFLVLEQKAKEFLSSEQIDLPGKLAAIKDGLSDALDILTGGGGLGEALEEGLKIKDAQTFITNLERVFGNAEIVLLQLVASLQEAGGQGQAAAATRTQVARLAQGQLGFDIQIANPEEIQGLLQTAIQRGVAPEFLSTTLEQSIGELIDEGQIGKARDLAAEVQKIPGALIEIRGLGGVLDSAIEVPLDPTLSPEEFKAKVDAIVADLPLAATQTASASILPLDAQAIVTQVNEAAQVANDAWVAAIQSRDFGAAAEIAKDFDPALVAETFRQSIVGGDFLTAEDLVSALQPEQLKAAFDQAFFQGASGVATQIADVSGDAALKTQAESLANAFLADYNAALAEGDLQTAEVIAQQLGNEDLLQQVTDLKEQIEATKTSVVTNSEEAAAAVEDMDERIANALTGNTVTESFEAVGTSADENLSPVVAKFKELPPVIQDVDATLAGFAGRAGGYFDTAVDGVERLYEGFVRLSGARSFVAGITAEINTLRSSVASLSAQLVAAQAGASAAGNGGGVVNNNSNITVTQNIASGAENASSNQQLLNTLAGGG